MRLIVNGGEVARDTHTAQVSGWGLWATWWRGNVAAGQTVQATFGNQYDPGQMGGQTSELSIVFVPTYAYPS